MKNTFKAYVLNIRFDTMQAEDGRTVDWANLHFAGEPRLTSNFVGADLAKLRIDPAEQNKLAKKLVALHGEQLPAFFEVECDMRIVQMVPQLICTGLNPV